MTNRSITAFLFEGEVTLRVIEQNNQPWFVAVDVCRALGIANPADAVRGLDEDEKGIDSTDTLGGRQEMLIVSESGLYAMIFKSRKPESLRFRKWVTSEVLPTLRNKGAYFLPGVGPADFNAIGKPYADWTLEERRTAISEINTCRHTFNTASAMWLWSYLGMPLPPRHLLPAWSQGDFLMNQSQTSN